MAPIAKIVEKSIKDPTISSAITLGLTVLCLLTSVLVLHGVLTGFSMWTIIGVRLPGLGLTIIGVLLTVLAMYAIGMVMLMTDEDYGVMKWHMEVDETSAVISGVGHVCAVVMLVLIMVSASCGDNYLKVNDPSTSIRGIGVEDLAEGLARNPKAYDVVLTDGYVMAEWQAYVVEEASNCAGKQSYESCGRDYYSAAPIYKNKASASGPPVAWAVKDSSGLSPTYCTKQGAGLCGFKSVASPIKAPQKGGLFGGCSGFQCAAQDSAEKGGFTMPTELPALLMVNPFESVKTSEKWYSFYYYFVAAFVLSMIVGNIYNLMAFYSEVVLGHKSPESDGLLPADAQN